jgi:hypothetical protein
VVLVSFDAQAYAEGICEHAAGSSIEELVDTIDATIIELTGIAGDEVTEVLAGLTGDPQPRQLAAQWQELRDAIVALERENDEGTFDDDDEGDD